MSLTQTLYLRTSLLLGSLLGLSYGCLINVGPLEPCASGSNNKLDENDECVCLVGYDWCNPDDPDDLDCCSTGNADEVDTSADTNDTVDTNDTNDTNTSADTGTGEDTTGDGDGDGDTGTPPPETCSEGEEGFYWCTHDEAMGPEGSDLYICMGGSWVLSNGEMDASCMFDGYDFAYGCVDTGTEVVFECGVGSGEACDDNSAVYCVDDDQIAYCLNGKETWDSCLAFCQEVGIDGVTYEYGECDGADPANVACFCCDSGDQDCPI